MSGDGFNNNVTSSVDGDKQSVDNTNSSSQNATHGSADALDDGLTEDGLTENDQPTVLVVDDSKTVLKTAGNYLADIGLSVITAGDGFEALAKVVETKPAMVFVDIVMPRLDGYQTCALIKNNADFRNIPVVMLSNKDGSFDRARGRAAGADDHLAKPFDAEQIADAVAKHLSNAVKSGVAHEADATISF